MSATRAVVVRPRAALNLAEIATRIARNVSARSAVSWRQRAETIIRALGTDADQWPEADEAAELGVNLRCRLFGRGRHVYRVLFTIDGDTVNVHRVRHAAQDRLQLGDV